MLSAPTAPFRCRAPPLSKGVRGLTRSTLSAGRRIADIKPERFRSPFLEFLERAQNKVAGMRRTVVLRPYAVGALPARFDLMIKSIGSSLDCWKFGAGAFLRIAPHARRDVGPRLTQMLECLNSIRDHDAPPVSLSRITLRT